MRILITRHAAERYRKRVDDSLSVPDTIRMLSKRAATAQKLPTRTNNGQLQYVADDTLFVVKNDPEVGLVAVTIGRFERCEVDHNLLTLKNKRDLILEKTKEIDAAQAQLQRHMKRLNEVRQWIDAVPSRIETLTAKINQARSVGMADTQCPLASHLLKLSKMDERKQTFATEMLELERVVLQDQQHIEDLYAELQELRNTVAAVEDAIIYGH